MAIAPAIRGSKVWTRQTPLLRLDSSGLIPNEAGTVHSVLQALAAAADLTDTDRFRSDTSWLWPWITSG